MYKKAKKQCGGAALAARRLLPVRIGTRSYKTIKPGLIVQSAETLETIVENSIDNFFTKRSPSKFSKSTDDVKNFVKDLFTESVKIKSENPDKSLKEIVTETTNKLYSPFNKTHRKMHAMENAEQRDIINKKNEFIKLVTESINDAMQPVFANSGRRTTQRNSVRHTTRRTSDKMSSVPRTNLTGSNFNPSFRRKFRHF